MTKIDKSDLIQARNELKQFRRDVSILKKKGILDKNLYDARSVLPTKYLKQQIKKFTNILKGEATTVKVSKSKIKQYKEQGFTVKSGRVIVPIKKGEKVVSTRGDFRKIIYGKGGSITEINLGLNRKNLPEWEEKLKKLRLKKDEVLRVQIFGNNMARGFVDIYDDGGKLKKSAGEQLIEHINYYPSFTYMEQDGDPNKTAEYIENISLYRIKRDPVDGHIPSLDSNPVARLRSEEQQRRQRERKQAHYEKYLSRMSDAQYANYRKEKAAIEKARRESMSEAEKEAYKLKAKLRSQKSYKNKTRK